MPTKTTRVVSRQRKVAAFNRSDLTEKACARLKIEIRSVKEGFSGLLKRQALAERELDRLLAERLFANASAKDSF